MNIHTFYILYILLILNVYSKLNSNLALLFFLASYYCRHRILIICNKECFQPTKKKAANRSVHFLCFFICWSKRRRTFVVFPGIDNDDQFFLSGQSLVKRWTFFRPATPVFITKDTTYDVWFWHVYACWRPIIEVQTKEWYLPKDEWTKSNKTILEIYQIQKILNPFRLEILEFFFFSDGF